MGFWKVGAHWRTLVLYLITDAVICGLCFYTDIYMGALAAVLCLLFGVWRLIADVSHHRAMRALERDVRFYLAGNGQAELPRGRRDEIYELRRQFYKMALALKNGDEGDRRREELCRAVLSDMAGHIRERAGQDKQETEALARDMERLARLWPSAKEESEGHKGAEEDFFSAKQAFADAFARAKDYLAVKQVRVRLPETSKIYVNGDGEAVSGVLAGVMEACARLVPAGSELICLAMENPSFTEFSVACEALPWQDRDLPAVIDPAGGAEPGFLALSILAERTNGAVQVGRMRGVGMRIGIRFFTGER